MLRVPNASWKFLLTNAKGQQTDCPAELAGKVALVNRPSCTFATKIADGQGLALGRIASLVLTSAALEALNHNTYRYNVMTQTKGATKGMSPLWVLTVTRFRRTQASTITVPSPSESSKSRFTIQFGWCSSDKGLLGAEHYVPELSPEERDRIRIYINFGRIASPKFVYEIYDGDGSAFGNSRPPGHWLTSGVKTEAEVALLVLVLNSGTPGQFCDPDYCTTLSWIS